ncbi:hypothetical protein ACJJTC_012918 [Scirpophaga incertulas]
MMSHAMKNLSEDQLNILLTFVEHNRHLAFGRGAMDSDSQYEHHCKWKELARDINALNMDQSRAGIEYKEYWKELKMKTYGKIYRARQRTKQTKQPVKVKLYDHEWRIYNIMPGHPLDKNLILEIGHDAKSINSSMTGKTIEKPEEHFKDKDEVLKSLAAIAKSMHSLAKGQAELAHTQISVIQSLNEVINKIITKSKLHQILRTFTFSPFLLSGMNEEKQVLHVELFSDFEDDQRLPVTDAYVELQSRHVQVYASELQVQAHFGGLRHFMYNWPKLAAILGISTNLFFVSLIFVLSWYHLQDGLPKFVKTKIGAVKTEEDDESKKLFDPVGKIKLEREDSSLYFDETMMEELQKMEDPKK